MSVLPPALPARHANLKIALLLGAAAMLATLALMPYLVAMMSQKLAHIPVPLSVVIAAQTAQTAVLCWLVGWLGLYLGSSYGLDAPWLRSRIERRSSSMHSRWAWTIFLGFIAGAIVLGLSLSGSSEMPQHGRQALANAGRGFLASFYGGIVEETEFRLGLISVLVWLIARCNGRIATSWMFVVAIILAALLFGAGHLPAAFASGMAHATWPVLRIILLNALVGSVFGWLFWKYGLEHAMVAHFSADIVLHVIAPLAL
ncbi:CPBP family glutamic-type intramembrane protease [Rhodanobacter sp. L36]|uniref:CPBP family glutamic-type intramembrane protease n=1 Tax=Rhodanobacter sp. L36 TaxID=1747221 RepID=UPI00131E6BF5|nr:CPBP family glutamic-type intramembrane protease [Rhodanobacter sp. L36]